MKKKEYVISLKMEDMTRELLFPQRSKEYMVLESTSDCSRKRSASDSDIHLL